MFPGVVGAGGGDRTVDAFPVAGCDGGLMDNPLDHMLQHTSAAARAYHVDDARVAAAQAAMPADRRTQLAQEAGWLSGHLVRIAVAHHAECDRDGCRTCDEIREALTVRMAMVRLFVDEQMTGSLRPAGLFRRR